MSGCVINQNAIGIYAGENKSIALTVKDPSGALFDLSGSTLYASVALEASSTTLIISKTSSVITEIEILNQVTNTGEAVIYYVPADTSFVEPATYIFTVWLEQATGEQNVIVPPRFFRVCPTPPKT